MHITSMEEHLEESNSEVNDSDGDTDRFMSLSNRAGGDANDASLLEDEDYDIYEGYQNDAYDLSDEQLTFYNSFDIRSEKQYAPISFATLVRNDSSKHVSNFCTLDTRTKIKDTTEMLIPLSLILEANVRMNSKGFFFKFASAAVVMSMNFWGLLDFACALIDIRVDRPLKDTMVIVILFVEGAGEVDQVIRRTVLAKMMDSKRYKTVMLKSQRSMEVKGKNGATTLIKDTTNMASSSNTKGLVNDINLVTLTEFD
ncbi:hypothetical protein Tco_0304275 [Tanacetum coccineum]